jgi:hypothetical protein
MTYRHAPLLVEELEKDGFRALEKRKVGKR